MKTKSEELFEEFLTANNVQFEKIQEDTSPRPDYLVTAGNLQLVFEVKELTEDDNFGVITDSSKPHIKSHSRTLGDHVRRRIEASKRQIQYGAKHPGLPSILLIYNNLDPVFQAFGTEDVDFTTAMYGELTILLDQSTRRSSEMFNARTSRSKSARIRRLAPLAGCATVPVKQR